MITWYLGKQCHLSVKSLAIQVLPQDFIKCLPKSTYQHPTTSKCLLRPPTYFHPFCPHDQTNTVCLFFISSVLVTPDLSLQFLIYLAISNCITYKFHHALFSMLQLPWQPSFSIYYTAWHFSHMKWTVHLSCAPNFGYNWCWGWSRTLGTSRILR